MSNKEKVLLNCIRCEIPARRTVSGVWLARYSVTVDDHLAPNLSQAFDILFFACPTCRITTPFTTTRKSQATALKKL